MRIHGGVGLVLPLLALPIGAQVTDPGPSVAEFEYRLGSLAEGNVVGDCTATGFFFPEGSRGEFGFASQGGTWTHFVTEFNHTILRPKNERPLVVELTRTQWNHSSEVPVGTGTVRWGDTGRVRMFAAPGPVDPGLNTFLATFDTSRMQASPLTVHPPGVYYVREEGTVLEESTWGRVVEDWGGIRGWNRYVEPTTGSLHLEGAITFFLEDVEVTSGADFHQRLPPRREMVDHTPDNDVATYWRVRLHHAFMTLRDVRMDVPAGSGSLLCRGIRADVEGNLTAWEAAGRVGQPAGSVEFARKELKLEGHFVLADDPRSLDTSEPGIARVRVEGQFRAVAIDFITVGHAPGRWDELKDAGLVAGLLALAASLWYGIVKWLAPLFSRLNLSDVEGQWVRRSLLDAISSSPGEGVQSLTHRLQLPESSARYHLALLERRGSVVSRKLGGERRYWQARRGRLALAALLPEYDPPVDFVRARLGRGQARLTDLMKSLRAECGLSRNGAYKAVLRAERLGIARRLDRGLGVWLECT